MFEKVCIEGKAFYSFYPQIVYTFLHIIIQYSLNYQMQNKQNHVPIREVSHQVLQLSYQKISFQLRKELINMVMKQGFTVYRASKLLNINNSTAKAIIRKYRRNGTIFMRKSQMERQELGEDLRKSSENQQNLENKPAEQEPAEQNLPDQNASQLYYIYPLGLQNCYIFQNPCFMTYF